MKIAVTGSHGLVARHLLVELELGGHEVVRLVRTPAGRGELRWDPPAGVLDAAALGGVDAVVHLAGAGLASRRWNDTIRRAILDSRVQGTRLLAERLAAMAKPPEVLVSASAIGIYGDRGDEVLTETSSSGAGFLAEVCQRWEDAAAPAQSAGVRTVFLRTGIVQAGDGGALKAMLPLFRLGLGARLGSGAQWNSWVSMNDEVGAVVHALSAVDLSGPVNVVAPGPVTNSEYTATLARVLGRPAVLSVPAAVLEAMLGRQMAREVLLASQRVRPAALEASGYRFRHPGLEGALRAALGQ